MTSKTAADRLRAMQNSTLNPGEKQSIFLRVTQADALIALVDGAAAVIFDESWVACEPVCEGCGGIECPQSLLARTYAAFTATLEE